MLLTLPNNYFDDRILLLDEAKSVSESQKDYSRAAVHSYELALIFFQKGDFPNSETYFNKALEYAILLRDKVFQLKVKSRLSVLNLYRGFTETAINSCFEILAFNSEEDSFIAYNILSRVYIQQDEELKSNYYITKADMALEEENMTAEEKCMLSLLMGLMNGHRGWDKTSLQNYNKTYVESRNRKLPYYEAVSLYEAAVVWAKNDVHKECLRLVNDAKEITETYGFKYFEIKCLCLEAHSQRAMGDEKQSLETIATIIDDAIENEFLHLHMEALELKKSILGEKGKKKEIVVIDKEISALDRRINQAGADKIKELLKLKEKELKYQLQKNRALLQQMEDLAALKKVFSHDLKEPLRNIGGYIGKLEKSIDEKSLKKNTEYFRIVKDATVTMDESLTALLNYLSTGSEESGYTKTNLEKVIDSAKEDLHMTLDLSELDLKIESGAELIFECEYRSFYKIFKELISNSVKFVKIGVPPVIRIRAKSDNDTMTFTYKDNGIGIDGEYHDKVFHLFNRLDRSYEGYGVGLATCKRIVNQHGGNIYLQSEEGKGLEVVFTIRKL